MALKRGMTAAYDEDSPVKKKMRMELGAVSDDYSKNPELGLGLGLGLGFWGTKRVVLTPPTDMIAGDCYHTPPPLRFRDSVPLTTTAAAAAAGTTRTSEATIKNPSFLDEDEDSDAESESTAVRSVHVPVPVPDETTIKKPSFLLEEQSPPALLAVAEEDEMEMEMEGYLRSMEADPMLRPLPDYLNTRKGSGDTHYRAMAIDWMAQIAQHCCFTPDSEILHLSVSYFDRYFSYYYYNSSLSISISISSSILLVALSCLVIATKYQGVRNDGLSLHYMCAFFPRGAYTTQEVIKMESQVLVALGHRLGVPTSKSFLDGFIISAAESDLDLDYDDELLHLEPLANYLAELSLLEYDCIQFLPSMLAASAVFLARFAIHPNKQPWCPRMKQRTGYTAHELKECVHIMHNLHLGRTGLCQFTSLAHKYETVAIWFTPPSEIPAAYFR